MDGFHVNERRNERRNHRDTSTASDVYMRQTIRNLKNRSNQFERRIDRELDDSRYDDRRRFLY